MEKLDDLRKKLADRNLAAVAKSAGIHPNSLYRLMKNDDFRPNMRTVEKLEKYLSKAGEK
jgi:DNA-binding phage protein